MARHARVPEVGEEVDRWQEAAARLRARSEAMAPLDGHGLHALAVGSDLESAIEDEVDALIRAGDAVLERLRAAWVEDDAAERASADGDRWGGGGATVVVAVRTDTTAGSVNARDSAFWLLSGQAEVAGDLLLSTQDAPVPPEALDGGRGPDFFAAAIRDPADLGTPPPPAPGAGTPQPIPPGLGETLDRLADAAGDELVDLGLSGAKTATPTMLLQGLSEVLGGAAGALLTQCADQVSGFFARVKASALRLVGWVLDRLEALVSPAVRGEIEKVLRGLIEDVTAAAGRTVGRAAAVVLGRRTTERAWAVANDAGVDLDPPVAALPGAIAPHLAQIAWVSRARGLADRVAGVLAAVIAVRPEAAIVVWLVVLAGGVAVLSRLWDGMRDVRLLVTAAG